MHAGNPSYLGGLKQEDQEFKANLGQVKSLSPNKEVDVNSVVECLFSMCETLSSIPVSPKQNKTQKNYCMIPINSYILLFLVNTVWIFKHPKYYF